MKSRFLPRVLGILLVIAGVAYVAHSVISLLLDGPRIILYERATMLARAAGEFPIMLWLLIKGADAPRRRARGPLAGSGRSVLTSRPRRGCGRACGDGSGVAVAKRGCTLELRLARLGQPRGEPESSAKAFALRASLRPAEATMP
jgi:hypothetical protein